MKNKFLNEREYSEGFNVSKELITEMMKSLHFNCIECGLDMEDVADNVTAGLIRLFLDLAKENQHLHGQHRLVGDIENLVEKYNLSKLIF